MPRHDVLRILPDLNDTRTDREYYFEEHERLFGHMPTDGVEGPCQHPIHDDIRRAMNGANIEVPFDSYEIVSDDSELERQRQVAYNAIFDETKEFQAAVNEEDAWINARTMGVILPDKPH